MGGKYKARATAVAKLTIGNFPLYGVHNVS